LSPGSSTLGHDIGGHDGSGVSASAAAAAAVLNSAAAGSYGTLSSMIMPTAAPLTGTPDSVIDITEMTNETVKQEQQDDSDEIGDEISGR